MDINKEREAFEKEMLDSRYVAGNILVFWDKKTQDYDIAITELRMAWHAWQAAKAQAVPETLKNDCMIGQTWFMKGSPTVALIKHAEDAYKAEAVAQNSKIEFGTDDNEHWFAHDVPFYGRVQIDRIEEHGLVEWDIHFNDCWQGPFNSKSACIKHLEECIAEEHKEAQEPKVTALKVEWTSDCFNCGYHEAIIYSTASEAASKGWFHDGDKAQCCKCGHEGEMDARGEDSDICWYENEAQEQAND